MTEHEREHDDERYYIEYVTPERLDLFFQRIPPKLRWVKDGRAKCSDCGLSSQSRPTSELTLIKHKHDSQPLGHLKTYCPEHLLRAREWSGGGQAGRTSGRTGSVCPTCHQTVPLTGICDWCGEIVERR
jgi:hypothetical protein